MTTSFIASSQLPTKWGTFRIFAFKEDHSEKEHVALLMGNIEADAPTLCRVHSECLTGDALFSLRCDCGSQLEAAMKTIAENHSGVILYLRQEGRNIGLGNKIKAYELQDKGADTVEANEQLGFGADERSYEVCETIFKHLGISKIKLMTNNPIKVDALKKLGIEVVERVPLHTEKNPHNAGYLATKSDKLGHMLD